MATLTVDERRSAALKGRPKSLETRAKMAASAICDKNSEPERWQFVFDQCLKKLQILQQLAS